MPLRTIVILGAFFFGLFGFTRLGMGHEFLFGVEVHVIRQPNEQLKQFVLAKKLGFDSVRTDAPWRRVEVKKNIYRIPASWDQFVDRANRLGLQPLFILDYGNPLYDGGDKPRTKAAIAAFAEYATFIVNHFKGRVHYYEIWNEWDTRGGQTSPGDAQDYARLFDTVYPEVKKADPTAIFMATSSSAGPGYVHFYDNLARLGVLTKADAVAFHPYVLNERGPEIGIQRVIHLESMMRKNTGRADVPIYITEDGWPTNSGPPRLSESTVAGLAARFLLLSSSLPYVKGVWWYDLRDDCGDETSKECRFGLIRKDYSLKPAGRAIQRILPLLDNSELRMQATSDLKSGLVVLKELGRSTSSVIAWYIPSESHIASGVEFSYFVRCDKSHKILQNKPVVNSRDLGITATPSVFEYSKHDCTRRPLVNSR